MAQGKMAPMAATRLFFFFFFYDGSISENAQGIKLFDWTTQVSCLYEKVKVHFKFGTYHLDDDESRLSEASKTNKGSTFRKQLGLPRF